MELRVKIVNELQEKIIEKREIKKYNN
jgi:Trp operon repressor